MNHFDLSLNEKEIISILKLLDLTELKIRGNRKLIPRDHISSKRKVYRSFMLAKFSAIKLAKREIVYVENTLNQFLLETIEKNQHLHFCEYFELLRTITKQTFVKNDLLYSMFNEIYAENRP